MNLRFIEPAEPCSGSLDEEGDLDGAATGAVPDSADERTRNLGNACIFCVGGNKR